MAGYELLDGQRFECVQTGEPARDGGVRGGGCAVVEDEVAGKEHAGGVVEHSQVASGVAVEGEQLEAVAADLDDAGYERFGRHRHFGVAHGVADQAVHVFVEGFAFGPDVGDGARQRAEGLGGEGLIAEEVVGVVVSDPHLDDRLVGGTGDGGDGLFAVLA